MRVYEIDEATRRRFASKYQVAANGCWKWTAFQRPNGYTQFRVRQNGQWVSALAHRVSYQLHHGSIPAGMEIDHTCHDRGCVNPDHLRAVTHKQNQENQRGAHKGSRSRYRGVSFDRRRGNWVAKLSHQNKTYYLGAFPTEELAAEAARAGRNNFFTHNLADRKAA